MDSIDFYQDYKNYGEQNYLRQKVGTKNKRNSDGGSTKSIKSINSIYRQYRGITNSEFNKFKTKATIAERESSDYIKPGFGNKVIWLCGICGSPRCAK
jgi:hypothetical protein